MNKPQIVKTLIESVLVAVGEDSTIQSHWGKAILLEDAVMIVREAFLNLYPDLDWDDPELNPATYPLEREGVEKIIL